MDKRRGASREGGRRGGREEGSISTILTTGRAEKGFNSAKLD